MVVMSKLTIRLASTDDLAQILQMGESMHAESSYQHMRYDARQYGEFVVNLLAGQDSGQAHAVFVADDGSTLQGIILCSAMSSFFGPDSIAYEHLFYVRPASRAHGVGLQLLHAWRDWADEWGVKRIIAGNSAGMDDGIYTSLLSRAGFRRAGSQMQIDNK